MTLPPYTLARLAPAEASAFAHLTFPAYRPLLGEPAAVAIAARRGDDPIGLALATYEGEAATLRSIAVAPATRGQGVATALLRELEAALRAVGTTDLDATYLSGQPATPAVEALLARAGWSPPQPRMVRIVADIARVQAEATWVGRIRLAADEAVIPWEAVTPEELAALRRDHERAPWIPPDLLPWENAVGCHSTCSVALRQGGAIAGWALCHAVGTDAIRYTCSTMRPGLRGLARILPLYEAVMVNALAAGLPRAIFTVPYRHGPMAAFATRRIAPWALEVGETRGATKQLLPLKK